MKKKSASKSAFFNLRVLIGLFIALAGISLALVGLNAFTANKPSNAPAPQGPKIVNVPGLPPGFDCSRIHELGVDKMEGLKWGLLMIACGETNGGQEEEGLASLRNPFAKIARQLLPTPLAFGAGDVDLVTGTETPPHIIQSETYTAANPDNPNVVTVAYNDSRCAASNNFSAVSVSTDGGLTFNRLTTGSGCSPFTNTFGDPVILYNKPTQTWFTVWLDGNGSCTLGGYKSTTPADPNSWTTHFCVHSAGGDDRESGWADNNPSSPHYGNMYVSWNDFNIGAGALEVTFSTDNGTTWHTPVVVSNTSTFIRDVQITGDLSGNGNIYIAGMDEGGGGFPHNNINHIYKSTDGGNTWANTYTGPAFPGPGVTAVGYFACMFPDGGGYWRHEGWGEPAVYNNVVSLVYAQHGTGSDAGDVYYIRSSDGGVTFSAPFKLNTDSTTRPQWQPNISVSPSGTLLATWYDARESTTCTKGNPAVPCYRMWSRKSNDNGLTWLPDDTLSDVVSPLPGQSDGNIQPTYAGDYDYGTALQTKHTTSWTDGRVAISGASQQDTFTDRELVGFAVTTTVPACNSIINTQPVDFVINLSDAVNTSTVQPTDFTVNNIPANTVAFSNGNTTLTFHFTNTPVTTQGPQTMHIPANAFTRQSDGMGNFDFTCTFCYALTPLMVTTTNPPVGGTFTPPAPGNYNYAVNFNQPVDPASVQDSDLTVSGNSGPSVTGHSVSGSTVTFMLHMNFGGTLTASIGAGSITANSCNGNAAFTGTYTVEGCPPSNHYTISQIGGSIVPGTVDTGNHCDDCTTAITLPFPYTLYDQTFTTANVDSNGTLQFVSNLSVFTNSCLPDPNSRTYIIFPYWDDLYNVNSGFGIFTSVSGTAPNRIFNIEHRSQYFPGSGNANFEIRLYEGQTRFDVIYGTLTNGNSSATAGVQKVTDFDQYFCNGSGGAATGGQSYILTTCGTPTPTPTASPSATPSATGTSTPTPTPTATHTPTGTPTATPTASPTCTPSAFHVLIAYSDIGGPPATLQSQILAEPGVTGVDLFDASSATPTLAQLQPYNIVVAFSNNPYADPVGMGNVLADYADTGGVVVGLNFDWFGPPFGLDGRWITGGYTPFNTGPTNFGSSCLGTYDTTHPLMQGISAGSLCAFFRHTLTLSPGAVSVAMYQDSQQLCAYKTNNGHTGVGINAYLGENPMNFSGPFGHVIVNAGRWLISGPCGTPTPTATPTATPTSTPVGCSWSAGPDMPTVLVRAVGVYFPTNGNFYTMGGRTADTAGSDFQHALQFTPGSNSWVQKASTFPDNQMNNMACGVLTVSGVPSIYCVGGSAAGATVATGRVFSYNPVTDTPTNLTGDDWPGAMGSILPGGFAVANNKLYILGGFNINVASTNQIWQFDPTAAVGAKWTLAPVTTPVGIMYAPTTTIGGIIYVGGASDYQGGTVVDTTTSFSFNPAINTIGTIAAIPRATGETRGLNFNGNMYVMGGGRVAPNPSTEVDVYNPGTNTWTTALPFTTARRNFPTDTNGTDHIWLSGGYDVSGVVPLSSMEIFSCSGVASPTPTATGTPSPTPTCPPGGSPGPWTQAAPVAVDHYGGFMDSDGTVAYEGGGYSFSVGDNTNEFGKFNPWTNTWTPLAPVPDLINAEASGVYAPNVNKLFVFGGDSPNTGTVVNTTRIYDIATNTWSTGAPMPDVRAFMASGYFNGKIYLVGGYNTGNVDPSFGQVWEYDPVANTFNTSRMSMPATLGGPGFGIINGHMYVAGGRDINNTNLNTLYDYDIAANTWTTGANMPSGVNVPGSAVIGGKLWVFGGGNPFTGPSTAPTSGGKGVRAWLKRVFNPDTTNSLQLYDPATNSWTSGPTLLQQRAFPAGTHVGNTAVAVGGYTGSNTTTSVEINVAGGGCASPTPTASPSATLTPTSTPTATATATHTPTATATATATFTPTATATATHTPTATATATATATHTPTATATATATATTTATATATATVSPRATPTPRPRPTPPHRP